ncbi:EsaB/YukD family protein [Streptomyces sp. NBC_00009]|uniref:EsaB/YukD family protein n=1 Tax=Streptomyces sp. NBC_00009 TaxID=2975620 RepID=UPI00325315FA
MISTGPLSRTALSRVTLVGARRRVELVLPSREPLGVLPPEVLRLLDDGSSPHDRLIAADGSALEPDSTLESAGVSDGAVLRLVRSEGSASTSAEDICIDLRTWRRRPAARRVVAGAATVVWAVLAGLLARQGQADALSAVGGTLLAGHDGSGAVGPPAALVVLALMSLGVLAVRPAEPVRVRLRRVGDVLESVGVIALLPLVIGVFGVYGRLLGTFA